MGKRTLELKVKWIIKLKNKIRRNKRVSSVFSVSRAEQHLRDHCKNVKISKNAPYFLASVVEYFCSKYLN